MRYPGWAFLPEKLTLSNITERLARAHGSFPALYDDGTASPALAWGGALSFEGLRDTSNRMAFSLIRHHDLKKGERVFIACENRLHALLTFFAVVKSGGIAVPLPLRLPPSEIRRVAEVARPALVVTDYHRFAGMALASTWTTGVTGAREVLTLGGGSSDGNGPRSLEEELAAADPFFIPYTLKPGDVIALFFAERNGAPRGVMVTNQALLGVSGMLLPLLAGRRRAGGVTALQPCEIAGLVSSLALLRAGIASSGIAGAARLAEESPAWKGRGACVGPPGTLQTLAAASGMPGLWISPRVEAAAPPSCPAMLVDGPVFEETCGWALFRVGVKRGGRVYKTPFLPLPSNRYRDGATGANPGGLLVKGKTVSFGYWFDLEEIARRLPDGWFTTGLPASRRRIIGYDL